MCAHSYQTAFPALCLSTSLGHLVVANDGSTKGRTVALVAGLSAFAVADAGRSIVEPRKTPEWAHVDHHRY